MELGPVFRALIHNRVRFWLITLEVALTLAIVVNCVSLALESRGEFLRDSGIDEENILVVRAEPIAPEYDEETYLNAARDRDLERLRAFPGVRAVTALSSVPLSGGGSATGRKREGFEGDSSTAPYFVTSPGAIEALGVELVAGRDFTPAEYEAIQGDDDSSDTDQPAILTRALASELFPDGDALGKRIVSSSGDASNIVIGIVEQMHNSWPNAESIDGHTMLLAGQPGHPSWGINYIVRAEEGAMGSVAAGVDELLLGMDGGRIIETRPLLEIKRRTYGGALGMMKMLTAVVVLLVLVTALGIVGLTSFSVSQRRRQIGTRRALGATRQDILRYFLLENWLVTGSGLALGLGLAWGLNYWLTKVAEAPKLDWGLLAGAMVLLWASGLLAALVPALRATRVAPVVATRTV
jgi:putative ABC transport system permease protein